MTARGWKIALAASVALNVFGLAGGVAAWVAHEKAESRVEAVRPRAGEQPGFREIIAGLDPSVRDRVRAVLRTSAQAAKPDFQAAREARQKAIALAASPNGEATEITALLDQSRAAEIRGRERLERDSVALFATLGPADRQALSVLLNRRVGGKGGGGDRRGDRGHDGSPGRTPGPREAARH
ncbi:hypothetical protein BH10PSE1_BH10PSE1_25220 [soil metagenome]